jgi:hypothetical protein
MVCLRRCFLRTVDRAGRAHRIAAKTGWMRFHYLGEPVEISRDLEKVMLQAEFARR